MAESTEKLCVKEQNEKEIETQGVPQFFFPLQLPCLGGKMITQHATRVGRPDYLGRRLMLKARVFFKYQSSIVCCTVVFFYAELILHNTFLERPPLSVF